MNVTDTLLNNEDSELHTTTDAESNQIDYEKIEKAFYNALEEYNENHEVASVSDIDTDLVQFASGTDASLFTAKLSVAPTSSGQQATALLLDIRNVLFLFLVGYFILTIYSKFKNLVINTYGKD